MLILFRRLGLSHEIAGTEEASKCFVALALYDTAPNNLTHFADPGKVKSCIEMGLPVVMTRISGIVPYLERFHAGEVIDMRLYWAEGALDRVDGAMKDSV